MISKREFKEKIKTEVMECLPPDVRDATTITEVEVVKINDQKLHGLTFRTRGSDASPTLYLEDAYDSYEKGADISSIAMHMAETSMASSRFSAPPEIDFSWDSIKDELSVRLVEKKRNRDFLRDKPYMSVGNGLAVMADINKDGGMDGGWRVAVTNVLAEQNGYDKELLLHTAMENMERVDPPLLFDMTEALFSDEKTNLLDRREPLDPADVAGMYVLSNDKGMFGAAALYARGVREQIAEVIGDDYYVLPSSTHEQIIVPARGSVTEKDLVDMVKQANRTVVEPQDILSDNVLRYDRSTRSLEKVDPGRDRDNRVRGRG